MIISRMIIVGRFVGGGVFVYPVNNYSVKNYLVREAVFSTILSRSTG